ncbi:MAG: hypothetical protein ACRD0O_20050 [Acidimicrobiia bacterium]
MTAPPAADGLIPKLRQSYEHVLTTLAQLPPQLMTEQRGELWATTKVLRRLAWHERSELEAMRQLLVKARAALSSELGR